MCDLKIGEIIECFHASGNCKSLSDALKMFVCKRCIWWVGAWGGTVVFHHSQLLLRCVTINCIWRFVLGIVWKPSRSITPPFDSGVSGLKRLMLPLRNPHNTCFKMTACLPLSVILPLWWMCQTFCLHTCVLSSVQGLFSSLVRSQREDVRDF